MRRTVLASLLLLAVPCVVTAAPRAPVRAAGDWPATPAGGFARDYVTAFNAGDDAMKTFYRRSFAPESLAVRPPEKRLARYHDLREQFGTLAFGGVVKDSAGNLSVRLLDADAVPHEFTFEIAGTKPVRLQKISMKQTMRGHPGFGGFHH